VELCHTKNGVSALAASWMNRFVSVRNSRSMVRWRSRPNGHGRQVFVTVTEVVLAELSGRVV
jgi:hypothetical protein